MAAPMPVPPPVTIATRPLRSKGSEFIAASLTHGPYSRHGKPDGQRRSPRSAHRRPGDRSHPGARRALLHDAARRPRRRRDQDRAAGRRLHPLWRSVHEGRQRADLRRLLLEHQPVEAIRRSRPEETGRPARSCSSSSMAQTCSSRTSVPASWSDSISPTRRWPPGNLRWSTARCAASAILAPAPARIRIGRPSTSWPRRCPAWWRTPARPAPPAPASGPSIGDLYPATLLALGITAGVHHARRTGEGQFVDVAMYDALVALCEETVYRWSYWGRVDEPSGDHHPVHVPFGIFPTADGACAIAAPTVHWPVLCEIMGRPDLVEDPRTRTNRDRNHNRALVEEVITAWTSARTTGQIVAELGGRVPVGPGAHERRPVRRPAPATARHARRDRHARRRPVDDLRQHRDQVHENSRGRQPSTSPAGRAHRRSAVGARERNADEARAAGQGLRGVRRRHR